MHPSRIVLGIFLILLGIGWLLQTAGIVHFDADIIAPIALIGIGIALVVGSPRGLHVPLLVGGIILAVILAGDSHRFASPTVRDARAGRTLTPLSASDLHPYRIGAGNLTIDLTALPLNGESYAVSARAGTGRIHLIVPSGTAVTVRARSSVGSLDIFGQRTNGIGTNDTVNISYPGRTRFVLDLRVGAGSILVTHRDA
jgi:hypothetical protein